MIRQSLCVAFKTLLLALISAVALVAAEPQFGPATLYKSGGRFVATGDFNGDGLLDLAVVAENSNFVRVLLNQGNGRFKAVAQYQAGQQPVAIVTADFNGDG